MPLSLFRLVDTLARPSTNEACDVAASNTLSSRNQIFCQYADGLLITGPVAENMQAALMKTCGAVPWPKLIMAVGACAISGGPYIDHAEVYNDAADSLPVDLFIPGCPPHRLAILDGLVTLLGRIDKVHTPISSTTTAT
jgi:Ni,Fe-hydrogenase III small subunit